MGAATLAVPLCPWCGQGRLVRVRRLPRLSFSQSQRPPLHRSRATLSRQAPEDVPFAKSRLRAETIGAEDVFHDRGILSMYSSDSQAMGRIGEVIIRCWQTAHQMKVQFGSLKGC